MIDICLSYLQIMSLFPVVVSVCLLLKCQWIFLLYKILPFITTNWLHIPIFLDWRRQWQPTPLLLPGKSHEWRSPVGCRPWRRLEWDTTEWLHFHFSLSCIGEGNGNPLQCSCLENPRDGGAWWAAVYRVTQSRTWLKQLSSSSSNIFQDIIPLSIFQNISYSTFVQKISLNAMMCISSYRIHF